MFAQLYECPKCVETWRVAPIENIDTQLDTVEVHYVCEVCGSDVWKPIKKEGLPIVHILTSEEMEEMSFSDEVDEGDEDEIL